MTAQQIISQPVSMGTPVATRVDPEVDVTHSEERDCCLFGGRGCPTSAGMREAFVPVVTVPGPREDQPSMTLALGMVSVTCTNNPEAR